jgi:uncharacterized protein (TIGR02266 family)
MRMTTTGRRSGGAQPRLAVAHSSALSGQRARTLTPEVAIDGDFDSSSPAPELISGVERVAAAAPDSSELGQVRQLLLERDLLIASLNQRVSALESELSQARQALREKAHVEPPQQTRSEQTQAPPAPNSGDRAAAPPVPPADEPGFPVLSRVSVALRDGMSLPPPSQPDAVPPSRRREPRRVCELELEFTDETHFYAGITQDLSQGGVFIATYRVFPVGSRLELGFQLPDGTEVRARGVVRWVRGEGTPEDERPGMGVAFSELSESALAAIAAFCRERAPLYMEL